MTVILLGALTQARWHAEAHAIAFLKPAGRWKTKEQPALPATDVRLHRQFDEAAVHVMVERIRTLRSRIEIGRSLDAAWLPKCKPLDRSVKEKSLDHPDRDRHQ